MMLRLLLADDHPIMLRGLVATLGAEPDLWVVGHFASADALLQYLQAAPDPLPVELLLLDLYMPGLDGLTLLPRIRQGWPGLRVLVFSSAHSSDLIDQVHAAEAHGFLPKSADFDVLLAAIRAVCGGEKVFPRPTTALPRDQQSADTLRRIASLTPREREVIGLIREGLSTEQIAERLFVSKFTVTEHRRHLMQKLDLPNVARLVRFAIEHDL